MTHLKLQKLQKGDYPPAHRLKCQCPAKQYHLSVIFAVLDVSFTVNSCLNHDFFLHLYLQFYYIAVAVTWYRPGTWYGVRDTTISEVLL